MMNEKVVLTGDYAAAIHRLYRLAVHDTGGSRAAQQVLLSAYDGKRYRVNVCDLGLLDQDYFEDAMTVIVGRTELNIEPHEAIPDGGLKFKRLTSIWRTYWQDMWEQQ